MMSRENCRHTVGWRASPLAWGQAAMKITILDSRRWPTTWTSSARKCWKLPWLILTMICFCQPRPLLYQSGGYTSLGMGEEGSTSLPRRLWPDIWRKSCWSLATAQAEALPVSSTEEVTNTTTTCRSKTRRNLKITRRIEQLEAEKSWTRKLRHYRNHTSSTMLTEVNSVSELDQN